MKHDQHDQHACQCEETSCGVTPWLCTNFDDPFFNAMDSISQILRRDSSLKDRWKDYPAVHMSWNDATAKCLIHSSGETDSWILSKLLGKFLFSYSQIFRCIVTASNSEFSFSRFPEAFCKWAGKRLPTEASHDSHGSYDSRGTPHSAIPTAPYGPAALRPCRLVGGVGERCQRKEERVRPPGDYNSFTRRDNCSVSFIHQELLSCSLLSPTKVPVSMGRQGLPWS